MAISGQICSGEAIGVGLLDGSAATSLFSRQDDWKGAHELNGDIEVDVILVQPAPDASEQGELHETPSRSSVIAQSDAGTASLLSIAASSSARNFEHDFEDSTSYHKTSRPQVSNTGDTASFAAVEARDGPLKRICLSCFVKQGVCEKVGPIPVEWTWDQVVNLI